MVELTLSYRPPYDLTAMLDFLRRRQVDQLELVEGFRLLRTLCVDQQDGTCVTGWIEATFEPDQARVRLRMPPVLSPRLGSVLGAVRQGLDLDADPTLIDGALRPHWQGNYRDGLRMAGAFNGFEAAVRIVLGQQVSVAAARTLTARLVAAFGDPVETPWRQISRGFPTARRLAQADPADIGRLGIVRQRVAALQALARAVVEGLPLHRNAPLEATLAAVQALPGIGAWTAQLIAMRCLAWPDAFPATDVGIYKALGHRDAVAAEGQSQAWRPWRSYAVMQLWMNLE